MKEYVGACVRCGVNIYCMDGFLNGTVAENGELYCFECHDKRLENTEKSSRSSEDSEVNNS